MFRARSFLLSLIAAALVAPAAAGAAPGQLDPTFGNGGSVRLLTGDEQYLIKGVAVQPDSKILLAGGEAPGSLLLVRLLADGQIDPGFGQGGKVVVPVPGGAEARTVAVQPDGRIVVAGAAKVGLTFDFLIARFNADGSPDGGFGGGDGIETVPVGAAFDEAEAVAIGPGGHILATGRTDLPADKEGAGVAVLKANGEPDPAFNGTGTLVVEASPDEFDEGVAIAERPDGRILVGDSTGAGAGNGFTLVQLTAAGLPDPAFGGGDGIVNTPIEGAGGAQGRLADFVLLPDGGIVASGYGFELVGTPPLAQSTSAAIAYRPDGELSDLFGDGKSGIFSRRLGDESEAGAIERTPGGRLLLAGDYRSGGASALQALGLEPLGILDQTFGSGGRTLLPPSPPIDDYFEDAALDSEERLVLLSTAFVGGGQTSTEVTRVLGNKEPVASPSPNQPPHARMKAVPRKVAAAKLKRFSGAAADADGNGVGRVEIAVVKRIKGFPLAGIRDSRRPPGIRCFAMKNAKGRFEQVKIRAGQCPQRWLAAKGKAQWSFKLKRRLPPGRYVVFARATDSLGAAETAFSRKLRNRYAFRVLPPR
ncbi:MAG TPA: delta-60 repeat domain-containing protein [Solirubrobacterales bacterium]|nr:delta-60 repeat domain-containing protein [Solirubrobacterales bacterium]